MMTDPIADILARIKNAYMAGKKEVSVSHSKMKESLLKLLSREGYLGNVQVTPDGKKRKITAELLYDGKEPKVSNITRMSKPGRRMYTDKTSIPMVMGGMGRTVLSTPSGLMTDKEAKKKGVGGEIICKIW